MAFNINIEVHGNNHQGKGGVTTISGKANSTVADLSGQTVPPFRFVVAAGDSAGVPPGVYERTGTDSSGNATYSPANRNH